jgi:hypothetical protein
VRIGTREGDGAAVEWVLADGRHAIPGVVAGADAVAARRIVERVAAVVANAVGWGCVDVVDPDGARSSDLDALADRRYTRLDEVAAAGRECAAAAARRVEWSAGIARLLVIQHADEVFRLDPEWWADTMPVFAAGGVAVLAVLQGLTPADFGSGLGSGRLRAAFVRGNVVHTATWEPAALGAAYETLRAKRSQVRALDGDGRSALLYDALNGVTRFELL